MQGARRDPSAIAIAVTDVDGDGDEDLFVGDSTGLHLLRNDGGNSSLAMQVQLVGLRTGSGKNNTFGIGSRIEVRAGDIYQTQVVTRRVTHFGLGLPNERIRVAGGACRVSSVPGAGCTLFSTIPIENARAHRIASNITG